MNLFQVEWPALPASYAPETFEAAVFSCYIGMRKGQETIFRYSDAHFMTCSVLESMWAKVNSLRFMDELTEMLPGIAEPIPTFLHRHIYQPEPLSTFLDQIDGWMMDQLSDDLGQGSGFLDEIYAPATDWLVARTFSPDDIEDSPSVYFFRYQDNLKITWLAEAVQDADDIFPVWHTLGGAYALPFLAFLEEVRQLIKEVHKTALTRLHQAVVLWPGMVDVEPYIIELNAHKQNWLQQIRQASEYRQPPLPSTDWQRIRQLLNL
ncbi:MAG TPA: DUF5984 family protein [Rhodothermales bacterium]|nr:hypothetical protein [Bacteroidota bacterium]HRK74367.1 DUF5984 family protein [Rhodothermales bacterium]HRR10296.1 DUF5984 family protein [Rhodothermales bacterium]